MNTAVDPVTPDSPTNVPDWTVLETDLHCPRCEYDLRMLTLPRCPECGLEFDWEELIAAAARERECPIFEYQWRRRPGRSFLYTIWLAIQPWRLWRTIKLEFEPRIGPLLLLAAMALVGVHLLFWAVRVSWQAAFNYKLGESVGLWTELLQSFAPETWYLVLQTQIAPLLVVFGSIAIYRITLVRHRIRLPHLLRIATYAWLAWIASPAVMGVPIFAVSITLFLVRPPAYPRSPDWIDGVIPALAFAIYLMALALGFARYLRLRRALIAAIASMTLATMAITVFTVGYTVYGRRRTFGDSLAPLDEWIPGLQWFCLRVLSSG